LKLFKAVLAVAILSSTALAVSTSDSEPEAPPKKIPPAPSWFKAPSSTLVEFSWTHTAAMEGRKPGAVKKAAVAVTDVAQRGVLAGYDAELKLRRWYKKNFRKPKPPAPTEKLVMAFEKPRDFLWETGGYVEINKAEDRATQGRYSLRAAFLLPSDLGYESSTGWIPSMSLPYPARGNGAELGIRDWSAYKSFRLDVSSSATRAVAFHVGLADIRGYSWEKVVSIPADSATTIEIPISAPREERLDMSRISEVKLGLETAGLTVRPVVYLDNMRFELIPPKVIASTITIESAVAAPETTRTATGSPKKKKK
jgi:hypothetical protein